MKQAVVIGSGFGGLALAIRLQSAGVATTVVEARDKHGGRAYHWVKDGHVFDAGPTVITDPDCLQQLWALTGHRLEDDVTLAPVHPFYRLYWPEGPTFDYSNRDEELFAEIAKFEPADVAGYKRFLAYSEEVWREGYLKLGHVAFLDFKSMIRASPALIKAQAWRSVYSMVSSFIRSDRLREAFSFHTLLVGGDPTKTSAIYALIHKLEKDGGVWFAMGGTNKLIDAMVRHFERIGGTVRLGDAVTRIETTGDRVTGVTTASGWRTDADAVGSNGDIVHTYRDLLAHERGAKAARTLTAKRFSPSLFVVHFGLEGTAPDVPHHSILFGPRYRPLLKEIYGGSELAEDFSLYLHHPTATDPSMAPPGGSTFYALAPVPHLGRYKGDWDGTLGEEYRDRILAELERRLIPDLRARLRTVFHYAPTDFGRDLNAHLGSAFSLEPVLTQSAWFRVHNRDDRVRNLYFVGAGTHPGAGIPGVVGSARATAALMLEELQAAA